MSTIGRANLKSSTHFVRAVRGKVQTRGPIDNGDGTVTDSETGLMWQKGSLTTDLKWDETISYARNLTLAGYNDWRLPTISEIESLIDFHKYNPALNSEIFSDTLSVDYWSSTAYPLSSGMNYCSDFTHGSINALNKSEYHSARFVRGGQNTIPGNLAVIFPKQ